MPELPEAVQQILLAALRRSPKDRPAYLDSACGSDAGLRARIESTLAGQERVTAPTLTAAGSGTGGAGNVPALDRVPPTAPGGGAARAGAGDQDHQSRRQAHQRYAAAPPALARRRQQPGTRHHGCGDRHRCDNAPLPRERC